MKKIKKLFMCVVLGIMLSCLINICSSNPIGSVETQAASVKIPAPKYAVKATGTSNVKIIWKKISGVKGYKIYRRVDGGNWKGVKAINSVNTTTYVDSKLKPGMRYYYMIRAYKVIGGKTYNGSYNKNGIPVITKLETPEMLYAVKDDEYNNTIKIGFEKVYGAKGYELARSINKSKWKIVGDIKEPLKNHEFKDNNLNLSPNNTFEYRVRAYCIYSGKRYYSGYEQLTAYIEEPEDPDESCIAHEEVKISRNEVFALKADWEERKIYWESENEDIAKIDQEGNVTGINLGQTIIRATTGNKTYTCKVYVEKVAQVDSTNITCTDETMVKVRYYCMQSPRISFEIKDKDIIGCRWEKSDIENGYPYSELVIVPLKYGTTTVKLTNQLNNDTTILNVTSNPNKQTPVIEAEKTEIKCATITPVKIYANVGGINVRFHVDDPYLVKCNWEPYNEEGDYWILNIMPLGFGETNIRITNSLNDEVLILHVYIPFYNIDAPSGHISTVTENGILFYVTNGKNPIYISGAALLVTNGKMQKMIAADESGILNSVYLKPNQSEGIAFLTLDLKPYIINSDSNFVYSFVDKGAEYMVVIKPDGRIVAIEPMENTKTKSQNPYIPFGAGEAEEDNLNKLIDAYESRDVVSYNESAAASDFSY